LIEPMICGDSISHSLIIRHLKPRFSFNFISGTA